MAVSAAAAPCSLFCSTDRCTLDFAQLKKTCTPKKQNSLWIVSISAHSLRIFFFEFVFCISINRLKFILYNNLNLLWNSKGSVWFDSIRHKLKSVISSNKLYWLYAWIKAHIRMLSVCPNQDILLKHLFGHIPHDATSRQYIRTIKRIKLKRNWLKLFFQPVKRNDLFYILNRHCWVICMELKGGWKRSIF